MKLEYFEIDRVIEDLSRNYAAPCTTTGLKYQITSDLL